jgi:hypothetical protein
MPRCRSLLPYALAASTVFVGACIAVAPHGIQRQTDEGSGGSGGDPYIDVDPDAAAPDGQTTELPSSADPHAVIGAVPSHGPFNGGQRVIVAGKGFASNVRVWFGEIEIDPQNLLPLGPASLQVTTPPGPTGPVTLSTQNGEDASTRRTLPSGFVYDAFYATPSNGPISGGNVIELHGQGTDWDANATVKIDQQACEPILLTSKTRLSCTTPKGTQGSKTISIASGGEVTHVLDGYTYEDSDNGYKGGLSGSPLAGQIKVLAYDNYTGDPIAGAHVIVGSGDAETLVAQTNASGVAFLSDPSLVDRRTVTVAAKCKSPISFVDVSVSTVTVYLDPILSTECGSNGDPPPVGGKPSNAGGITGELSWGLTGEFKRSPWTNVPSPISAMEHKVAYVFLASTDATAPFQLPNQTAAVTPETGGSTGYEFAITAQAGNRTLYVLAGIRDDSVSPARFTAYAMGLAKGISVKPGGQTSQIHVAMKFPLDGALTMTVDAPAPGPKGPDRLLATVSVALGAEGYAILPGGRKTPLLPMQGSLAFVGLPWLGDELAGATYCSNARAATGPSLTTPLSVVGRVLTNTTAQPVHVAGFVGAPKLIAPAVNTKWDGRHLTTKFPPGPIDLTVYTISSGNGLVQWTVAVPKGSHVIELPNLANFSDAGLPAGSITIGITGARIDGFSYNTLTYRDLRASGMNAYSIDYFNAHL